MTLQDIVQKISDETLLDYLCLCHEKGKVPSPEYEVLKCEKNRRIKIQKQPRKNSTVDVVFKIISDNESEKPILQWDKTDTPTESCWDMWSV